MQQFDILIIVRPYTDSNALLTQAWIQNWIFQGQDQDQQYKFNSLNSM